MTEGKCPFCGAPVTFTAGSAQVLVCSHCQTVLARVGQSLADRGKVARIVDTDSPLRLGTTGAYRGAPFRVVGRIQKDYGAGPWDEWALHFESGAAGWLAESEGEWHLMRPLESPDPVLAPARMTPGQILAVAEQRLVVEEVGEAKTLAAEGQLPSDFDPAATTSYADATGADGVFASFEGEPGAVEVFLGDRVKLAALQIPEAELVPRPKKAQVLQARCTQCNGPLELRAPDHTRRVACPYCGALLDVSAGKLAFLQLLQKPAREPRIPLGGQGVLEGTHWVCVAFLLRSCEVEGQTYPWEEYLIFNQARGFAWLVFSEGQWQFLAPIAAGDVVPSGDGVRFGGQRYTLEQETEAVTDFILGECYWAIEPGERSTATEYRAGSKLISLERVPRELTYTAGSDLPSAAVSKAFALTGAESVPIGPGLRSHHSGFWFLCCAALLCLLQFARCTTAAQQTVYQEDVHIPLGAAPGSPEAMHFTHPFELTRSGNLEVTVSSSLSNTWLGLEVDLVDDATQEVRSASAELSYYSGYDSDGSWTEGNQTQTLHFRPMPAGHYLLRVTPFFDAPTSPGDKPPPPPRSSLATIVPQGYRVQVVSDVPGWGLFLISLVLLTVGQVVLGRRKENSP